jgi:UDP-N-acetylglucosamine 1-carboxyvinyltransferase
MSSDAEKIGKLISQVREQRGLTQTQLAKKLGTSQSAVNRIERGKQNVSLDMLGRVSDVLNKEIIKVATGSVNFKIEGGNELKGTIETKVSKNAAMGLMAASLLNKGTTRLIKIPKIEEVYRLIEVLHSIGVSVKWQGEDLVIKPPAKIDMSKIDSVAAKRTRSILLFLGPLIHLFDEFKIPYSGGCKLGERTVKPHLYALEDFGVDIKATTGNYLVKVKKKNPDQIVLYETGDTVTENALMAAAGRPHTTTIKMASANYMVQEVCFFLKKLGVKVEGIGTTTLTVTGVSSIKKNVSYAPSEDPIESMLFITIAAVTNSPIKITRCPIEFLELELLKLKKMGFVYKITDQYKAANGKTDLVDIKVEKHDGLKALEDKIHPMPFPGINIDNLPYFVPIAAVARGRTLIHDWVYENRAVYYTELSKLGGRITLADAHRVYIDGPTKFSPAEIVTPPALRPAVIILIAMLAAKGTSVLRNVYSISRGYEDLAERLNKIGADITVIRDA